ncbi:hypothetical protein JVU11DRAFT_7208 [Chiua virens]|nr:hypothetical protein JVU11DRAFT_7208 [Chiua virens]
MRAHVKTTNTRQSGSSVTRVALEQSSADAPMESPMLSWEGPLSPLSSIQSHSEEEMETTQPTRHNSFCTLCQDGGDSLYLCSECPRVVCEVCLPIPSEGQNAVWNKFVCTSCQELKDRKQGRLTGFFEGFTISKDGVEAPAFPAGLQFASDCGASARRQIHDEEVLILHFYCKGMDPVGSPPSALEAMIGSYFPCGALQLRSIQFDLGTDRKVKAHNASMEKLAEELCSKTVGRVVVFVTTHSDVESGNLFAGEFAPSAKIPQLFHDLFGSSLKHIVRGGILVLLSCWWSHQYPESRAGLQDSVKSLQVKHCIAFSARRFQPALASFFLTALFFSHLIEGFDIPEAMPKALTNGFDLGTHADVFCFSNGPSTSEASASFIATKYVWWNANHRPYGTSLPLLCPVCRAVRPWKQPVIRDSGWTVQCGNPCCGLRADGTHGPAGLVAGTKPLGIKFVTPTKSRPSGWFSIDVTANYL